ncbi:MAG TPA: hypothetical protein PKL31_17145 [Fulvivirga sp.]|nr:hypothetical protein [Fulvivirga sp.]
MKKLLLIIVIVSSLAISCSSPSDRDSQTTPQVPAVQVSNGSFGDYWYAGKAELSSYALHQARYGQIHEGTAVLIFVTEPFSKSKQVKLDHAGQVGADEQTVLKLNFTKKFNTGIYPYSMMLSSFTPIEREQYPNTPKVTMSSQEWCGQVYSQMNLRKNSYDLHSYSYFEQEGDINIKVKKALLEDEVWNRIRLDYKSLPIGEIEIVPGLFYTRLLHKNLEAVKATASLSLYDNRAAYIIKYPSRELSIFFEVEFPHKILGWKEIYDGLGGKQVTTSAELDKTILLDYWNRNKNEDSHLRDSLNLQ